MKQLVLASQSPARKEILTKAGVPFVVDVSDYDEDMTLKLAPAELAKYLSMGKAKTVAARHKHSVILGADSFAVFNGQLLGKPHTPERAKEMLTSLSGQCHSFITGFSIVDTDSGKTYSEAVESKVYFKQLSPETIKKYVSEENILGRAAAYSIQGKGMELIERIDGDHNNVIGLPLAKVAKALESFGVTIPVQQ